MKRTVSTVERARELVGAALIWGHGCQVAVSTPRTGGRPTYTVEVPSTSEEQNQAAIQ